MKVGDLVKWTHHNEPDVGIVVGTHIKGWGMQDYVLVEWTSVPEHSGPYHPDHKLFEVIQ